LQDTDGRFLEQVLLGMRNRNQPRFGRVFEVMVATPDPHQVPPIRNNLAYQESAIHNTSLWCYWWVLYLLGENGQHYNHRGHDGWGEWISRLQSRSAVMEGAGEGGWLYCEM
jgi:hypothetical protein